MGDIMYKLGDQFEFNIDKAIANEEAVLKGPHFRFTVITERLIRLEYSPTDTFIDYPSQMVLLRNVKKPNFNVKQDDEFLEISTKYFVLQYAKGREFLGTKLNPISNLKITLKGAASTQTEAAKEWYYKHPEIRNYLSSGISFDEASKILYRRGLYSLDGFASIDDSNTLLINNDGTFMTRPQGNIDIYVFMYNTDYDLAMKDYFLITGRPAFIPRYALGNWWSKDIYYTSNDIERLITQFQRKEVPISVLLLSNWSLLKQISSYSFEKNYIPNPSAMINYVHNNNIRIGLKINPKNGISPNEDRYHEAIKYLNIPEGSTIPFNVYDPRFIDVYLKLFIQPLESIGVDFIWNDYDVFNNVNALWTMNHYQYLDSGRNVAKRNMLLSRNGLIASHRYPVLYSGKTIVSWENLKTIPFYNLTASNLGVTWWSHDVCGNYGGIEDSELYIRSIQLGVFSPILRFNVNGGKYYKREPWRWDVQTETIASFYLNLRHRLIPYLYTEAYNYYKNLQLLVKPFYYNYPWVYDDSVCRNQYFFGSQLFVAPITEKMDPVMKRTIHKFFVPEGTWYDFTTGKRFSGNRRYIAFFKEEDYPVFARTGSIIPLSNKSNVNNIGNPSELEIHIFPGQSNSYVLYEDDGTTALYKEGYFLKTNIEYNYMKNNYTVIINSLEGKSGIVPQYRDYKIKFRNTKRTNTIEVKFNSSNMPFRSYVDENNFVVEVEKVPSIGQLTINCKGQDIEIDAVRVINEDIDSILMDLQIETTLKEQISNIMFGSLPMNKKRIAIRKLKKQGLNKNYMKLFLKLLEYITTI